MANIARLKTWNLNETLTSADLNAEFDNILSGTNNGSLDSDNIDQTDTYTWSGNHTFNSLVTHGANLTVGVDDTGHDVKFFGATTGKYMLWDESADTLAVVGTAITLNGTAVSTLSTGSANTWTADQTFNDNVKVTLGTGGDADLYYDGTNVVLNTAVVGSGVLSMIGSMAMANAAGPTIVNEAATATNPTIIPNKAEVDTGLGWAAADTLTLITGGTERMRIGATGKINTVADLADNTCVFTNSNAGAVNGIFMYMSGASNDDNTQYFFLGTDSTTNRIFIYSDGDLANHDGIYGTISDVKFKQDIADARSYWDDFKSLQYRKFRHKSDVEADENAPYRLGLIAQEVETVFPALVPESPDGDGIGTHKWVKSSIIEGPIMASVVQELQERDGEKSSRILALEARVAALEAA